MGFDEPGEILGRKVQDRHGRDVGSVENIVLDPNTGRVSFAVVGFAGPRDRSAAEVLPVPWSALAWSSEDTALHLSVGRAGVARAPTIERDELGDLGRRDVVVEVFSYYGVQPPWDGKRQA